MNIIIEKEEFLNEGAFIGNIRDFINEEDFNNVKDYSNNLKKYIESSKEDYLECIFTLKDTGKNDYENIDIDSMFNLQKWIGLDNFNKIKDEAFLSKKMYSSWNLVPYFGDNNYFESALLLLQRPLINVSETSY